MKIVIFTDSYKPQINGLVTSIKNFTNELRKHGHKVIIFAPSVPSYKDTDRDVHRIRSIKFANYKEYRIALPLRLIIDPKISRVDIIHVHSPFSVGITGMLISKQYNIPCVSTFHTIYSEYSHYLVKNKFISGSKKFKKIFNTISWRYMRWFYNNTDLVISPSAQTARLIRKNGIKKPVVVIPTGIKFHKFRNSKWTLRRKYGFGKEKLILHVGRITKEKNIEFILKSLRNMLNESHKLIITSDGPYKETLERISKSIGIDKYVIFTGYLSEKSLREYYAMSDVFVMASKTETQGLVLLEAVNSRLPIVVLKSPVISDFVNDNNIGIVSNSRNFRASVEKVLHRKALRRKFINNCKKVKKTYDIGICTSMLLDAYNRSKKLYSQ